MDEQISHILVVEDDEAHINLVRRAFRATTDRFRLTIAHNLQEAHAFLAETTPTLVIADWPLPDGEGTTLLLDQDQTSAYPVLIMTSFGDERMAGSGPLPRGVCNRGRPLLHQV